MFQSIQSIAEKAAYFLIILFGVLLPYDMLYATVVIYPLMLCAIIGISKEKIKRIPKQWWIFTLVFLLSVLGYVYSTDRGRAGFLLERQLTILLFPILLPLAIDITEQKVKTIFQFFTLSCVAALLFLFYTCFAFLRSHHMPFSDIVQPQFYNHSFTKPIGIHATYLALYVSLCIVFLLSNLIRTKTILQKAFSIIIISFLALGLFFLASRNTIIATVIIVLLVFPIFSVRHKLRFFVIAFLSIVGFLFLGNKMNYISARFSHELIEDLQPNNHYTLQNPEPRIMRWQCAIELIKKRPIIGYGTGDEIPRLEELYLKKNMKVSLAEEFNVHNAYLSMLLKNGIVGLIIFMAMFVFFFKTAIQNHDFLYLSFLLLLVIGFITENILDANKGIFFFAFFNTLLGYFALNKIKIKT